MPKPPGQPDEFYLLRIRAQKLRDQRIAIAKQEFEQTLIAIARLEQDLVGNKGSRHTKAIDAMKAVMPTDREFTIQDLKASLEARYSNRIWHRKTIITYVSKLCRMKQVRRTKRAKNDSAALYVRAGVEVPERKFGNMTMLQALEELLTEPLNQTELAIRLMESDFETGMRKDLLRKAVGRLLRTNPQFRRDKAGKWTTSED